jgi:hypothetical protein
MKRTLAGIAAAVMALLAGPAWGQSGALLDDMVKALRGGGYVIVVRHGATHADQADTDPLNLDNVGKQRQLNDKGRADARAVVKEGEFSIFKPDGSGKYTLLGRVPIGDWAKVTR